VSANLTITIECDICSTYEQYDGVDDLDDANYNWEQDYNACDIEVHSTQGYHSNYYDHVCEGCRDDLIYCENCDRTVDSDEAYYCDEGICDDCVGEMHESWRDENPETFDGPECKGCGYEMEGPDIDRFAGKASISL